MKTTKSFLTYFGCTLLLVGAGFAAGYTLAPSEVIAPLVTTQTKTKTVVRDDTSALTLAQSEIAALQTEREALLKQVEALKAMPLETVTVEVAQQPKKEERRMSPRERMEELKKNDPERYQEMQERRAQWQQRVEEARTARDDFLGSVDLTLLTEEQQDIHARYTEALKQQEALQARLNEKFENGEIPTEEDRLAMRETFREMGELQEQERVALLSAVGTSMGLPEEDVESFTSLIQEVYDVTSRNGGMRRMGPPMGGPMGGPPPPQGP